MPDDTPRKENLLTRKIGPLPTWAWTAIVGGAVILWALYQRSKQSQAQAAASTAPNTVPPVVMQDYDTTNVSVTTPPDQDDHREDNDADDKRKRRHPRPPRHTHTPGPATHHKRHRPPGFFPGGPERSPVEPRPGPALQGR